MMARPALNKDGGVRKGKTMRPTQTKMKNTTSYAIYKKTNIPS